MSLFEFIFGRKLLKSINHNLHNIMANQTALAAQLTALSAQAQKIEIDLQAVIDAGPTVTPELQAAVDKLATDLQAIDDLVPDAAVPTP